MIDTDTLLNPDAISQEAYQDLLYEYFKVKEQFRSYKENLIHQARRVRHFSDVDDVYEAVPLKYVLEQNEGVYEQTD